MKLILFFLSTFVLSASASAMPEPVACFEEAPRILSNDLKVALCAGTEDHEKTIECFEKASRTLSVDYKIRLCSSEPTLLDIRSLSRANLQAD